MFFFLWKTFCRFFQNFVTFLVCLSFCFTSSHLVLSYLPLPYLTPPQLPFPSPPVRPYLYLYTLPFTLCSTPFSRTPFAPLPLCPFAPLPFSFSLPFAFFFTLIPPNKKGTGTTTHKKRKMQHHTKKRRKATPTRRRRPSSPTRKGGKGKQHHPKGGGGTTTQYNLKTASPSLLVGWRYFHPPPIGWFSMKQIRCFRKIEVFFGTWILYLSALNNIILIWHQKKEQTVQHHPTGARKGKHHNPKDGWGESSTTQIKMGRKAAPPRRRRESRTTQGSTAQKGRGGRTATPTFASEHERKSVFGFATFLEKENISQCFSR